MRKRTLIVAAMGLTALLVAGGLFASNMGFKLNYPLDGPGGGAPPSNTGVQFLALPFNQQTNLTTANDLLNDMGGTAVVDSISRYVRSTDTLSTYTGLAGSADFPLAAGDGYLVTVKSTVPYIVVGSHNPSLGITLDGPGAGSPPSNTGVATYSYPYHSTSGTAFGLLTEINTAAGSGVVDSISRYVRSTDTLDTYTGLAGSVDFPLIPGEAYLITVTSSVTFTPSHY